MVTEKRLKISTALGRQAAREAAREEKKHPHSELSAPLDADAVFEKRFQALGLGSTAGVARQIYGRFSSDSEGLTEVMVKDAIMALNTKTTDVTGEKTTQIEALETAKREWKTDLDALRGDDFLTGFVKDNVKAANPKAAFHWIESLGLGPFDTLKADLYKSLNYRTSNLTPDMVGEALNMVRTVENPDRIGVTQVETLRRSKGIGFHAKSMLTGFVQHNLTQKYHLDWKY